MRESDWNSDDDRTLVMERLLGRESEMSSLMTMIDSARLIGISGPPGIGKSTLAERAMQRISPSMKVSLARATDTGQCARAVLHALGSDAPADESSQSTMARLGRILSETPRTLLLDDADGWQSIEEHIENLLVAAPELTVVVTRQASLRSRRCETLQLSGLSSKDARELFLSSSSIPAEARAESVNGVIDAIVNEVDGNPLAIELAASRTLVMSPQEILERLEDSLDILRSSSRRDPRHRSIESALQLSWKRLSQDEQTVFASAARLGDGLEVQALEYVCDGSLEAPAVDVLEALVIRSLLDTRVVDARIAFSFSPTIRSFAANQLSSLPHGDRLRNRAEDWTLRVATECTAALETSDAADAFARLRGLEASLLAEAEARIRDEDFDRASSLLSSLRYPALLRGPLERYAELLERIPFERLSASNRAELASFIAEVKLVGGKRLEAEDLARQMLDADSPPNRSKLRLQRVLGMARSQSYPDEAERILNAAIDEARGASDRFMEARLTERLGFVSIQSNRIDRAWLHFSEARQTFELLGTRLFLGDSTTGLGYVEMRKSRLEAAAERLSEAVALHEEVGNRFHCAGARFNLGVLLHALEQLDRARTEFEQASATFQEGGFVHHRVPTLTRLALVQLEAGRHEEARKLFSEVIHVAGQAGDHHNAAIAFCERSALDLFSDRPIDDERLQSTLQGMLVGADPDAFASALVLLTVVSGRQGRPTLPWVNRLEELVALFAEDDEYSRSTVTQLRDVSRAWHLITLARNEPDGPARNSHVAAAYQSVSPLFESAESVARNPFVRLWLGRLTDTPELSTFSPANSADQTRLLLHRDGLWYAVDDLPAVDLSTRRPLSLIMRKFAQHAEAAGPGGFDVDDLAEAGWPGEPLQLATRRNRVYTAVRFLREMDLEEILVTSDDGYGFAPDVLVRLTDDSLRT